uniref:Putative golgi to vacuole transport-related protein n=1 Tax=Cryptococcus depauperatus TaxID=5208 RepID=D2JWW3_9TREE|nr:putative golgi to vacuole transport-related protein [Cryptococcus depauperatus]
MLSAPSWSSLNPVQALVEQCCDPTLPVPNDVANSELIAMINHRKSNSARDAAHGLLPHINSRNPTEALLALNVLDCLVKHCGYPMHLQISTKEFLNELVRRFPERPPMVIGRVMGKILELIHEWKNTICVSSNHKDDLTHIRDMHRLLSYKGYRFKPFDAARALASANPNENLKSPEELEAEDRAAKSAKLQELIRRGTPRDLAAAQELMKTLAGADPEKAVDYSAQTLKELDKVQSKALLLDDMLNNAVKGEKIGLDGDVYDQVATACKGARPKIQKWIEDDHGFKESMMDLISFDAAVSENVTSPDFPGMTIASSSSSYGLTSVGLPADLFSVEVSKTSSNPHGQTQTNDLMTSLAFPQMQTSHSRNIPQPISERTDISGTQGLEASTNTNTVPLKTTPPMPHQQQAQQSQYSGQQKDAFADLVDLMS